MEDLILKELDWDYIPQTYTPPQEQWNQTLHTKINQIWANNRLCYGSPTGLYEFEKKKISMGIPLKFKPLIESLEFYKVFDQKYNITFIDEDRDYIDIGGCKLRIKNYQVKPYHTYYEFGLVATEDSDYWTSLTDEEKIEQYFTCLYGDKFSLSMVDDGYVTEFCNYNKIDKDKTLNYIKLMTNGNE